MEAEVAGVLGAASALFIGERRYAAVVRTERSSEDESVQPRVFSG